MAVASRAADGQTLPDGECCVDSVDDVLDLKLFRDDTAFRVASMVAVEACRDFLIERRVRQQIASQLLNRELIERHVLVEGFEYPVTPTPHVSRTVRLIAVGVCVPRCIEPANRHSLGIARRLQQPIDDTFVSVG